jgi:hypothetical protein
VAVTTNFQNWNVGKKQREEILKALNSVFAHKPGKWHVQFIGSGGEVELRISGPGVEISALLDPAADSERVAETVARSLES